MIKRLKYDDKLQSAITFMFALSLKRKQLEEIKFFVMLTAFQRIFNTLTKLILKQIKRIIKIDQIKNNRAFAEPVLLGR